MPKRRQWPSVSIVNFEHVIAGWVNICFHIISPPFSVGGHLQSQILKREGSKKKIKFLESLKEYPTDTCLVGLTMFLVKQPIV